MKRMIRLGIADMVLPFLFWKGWVQMGFTRKELVQFLDGLMELVSEENKTEALLVKEKFISDFEKSYGFEREEETVIEDLPPYYVAAMPDDVQEVIRQEVTATLTKAGDCTPENIENAMCSKIYDLDDTIDIRKYVRMMEEGERDNRETEKEKCR